MAGNFMQLRPRDFQEEVPYSHTEFDFLQREYEHELQATRRARPRTGGARSIDRRSGETVVTTFDERTYRGAEAERYLAGLGM